MDSRALSAQRPGRTQRMTDERLMTPFGFASTADEVLADVDLSGKCVVVTGAASGIGVETARALASVGTAVVLAVRRPEGPNGWPPGSPSRRATRLSPCGRATG